MRIDLHKSVVLLGVFITTTLLGLLAACSAGGGSGVNLTGETTPEATTDSIADQSGLLQIPADEYVDPAEIRARRSSEVNEIDIPGGDCFVKSGNVVIETATGYALLDPGQEIAWLMFEFPEMLPEDIPVDFEAFLGAANLPDSLGLGIADYGNDEWYWIFTEDPAVENTFVFPDGLDAISPGGSMYVLVIVGGDDTTVLERLVLHLDTHVPPPPPVEGFSATKACFADRVILSWTTDSGYDGYEIDYRNLSGGTPADWTRLFDIPDSETGTIDHTTLSPPNLEAEPMQEYDYRIRGVAQGICSEEWSGGTGYLAMGAGSWCQTNHDRRNTRRADFAGPVDPTYQFIGSSQCDYRNAVFGVDGSIYLGGSWSFGIRSLDPDGGRKWSCNDVWGSTAPVIAPDGTLYCATLSGNIAAVNPDGTVLWINRYGEEFRSCVVRADDGSIYIGCTDGNMYGLNPDGTEKFIFPTGDEILDVAAVADDGTVIFSSQDQTIYAVDPDGNLLWSYYHDGILVSDPSIAEDGTIYIGTLGSVLALNADGTLKWEYMIPATDSPNDPYVFGTPAIGADGAVHVTCYNSRVYCLNPDGTLRWSFEARERINTSATVDSTGRLYFCSLDQYCYCLDTAGQLVFEHFCTSPMQSNPAINHQGTVYFLTSFGSLFALTDSV